MSGEFSEEARKAMATAREHCRRTGQTECGLKPLFEALLVNLDELSFQSLEKYGIDPESISNQAIEPAIHDHKDISEIPLSQKARRAVEYAIAETGSQRLYPSHLLLGVVKATENFSEPFMLGNSSSLSYERLKRVMTQIKEKLDMAVEYLGWDAVNTLYFTKTIAAETGNLKIGLPHLLAGSLMEPSAPSLAVFSSLGLDIQQFREESLKLVDHGPRAWKSINVPVMGEQALEALFFSNAEARGMEFRRHGSCHIFLGLLRANQKYQSIPFLSETSLDLVKARWAVLKMANWNEKHDSHVQKYSAESIKVLSRAAKEARSLGNEAVNIDHILVGILDDQSSVAYRAISHHVKDIKAFVGVFQARSKNAETRLRAGDLLLSDVTRKALELAKAEAKDLGRPNISPECILLGLLKIKEGTGLLHGNGLEYKSLKETFQKELLA